MNLTDDNIERLLDGKIVHHHFGFRSVKVKKPKPPREKKPSPYFTADDAADYLGITVKALYGHLERGRLKKLKGMRNCRFTKEQLDNFVKGVK